MSSERAQAAIEAMKGAPAKEVQLRGAAKAAAERKAAKMRTIHEHLVPSTQFPDMEDADYFYTALPKGDNRRNRFVKQKGYEPAPDHANNSDRMEILRIPKKLHRERYQSAVQFQQAIIGDVKAVKGGAFNLDNQEARSPETMKDLLNRMPEESPGAIEDGDDESGEDGEDGEDDES